MTTPTYPKIINNSLSNPTAAIAASDTDEAAVTAVSYEALAAKVGFVNNFIETGTGYSLFYLGILF
ncbi:MAG: hypothetical protein GY739_12930 [Mesoflavibacter sp.]|nr:hypothetical protein [Mesoflavibacter sp.]